MEKIYSEAQSSYLHPNTLSIKLFTLFFHKKKQIQSFMHSTQIHVNLIQVIEKHYNANLKMK